MRYATPVPLTCMYQLNQKFTTLLLLQKLKKMRMSEPVVASTMEGKKEKIEEHFKDVYENLYNNVDDEDNI